MKITSFEDLDCWLAARIVVRNNFNTQRYISQEQYDEIYSQADKAGRMI